MRAWWFMAHGWPRGAEARSRAGTPWPRPMRLEPSTMNHKACIKHQASIKHYDWWLYGYAAMWLYGSVAHGQANLLLVNLGFVMCHIYWSETEQPSVLSIETDSPWLARLLIETEQIIGRSFARIFHLPEKNRACRMSADVLWSRMENCMLHLLEKRWYSFRRF